MWQRFGLRWSRVEGQAEGGGAGLAGRRGSTQAGVQVGLREVGGSGQTE